MKPSGGSFRHCHNAQTLVDEDSQVILSSILVATFRPRSAAAELVHMAACTFALTVVKAIDAHARELGALVADTPNRR